ncbi:hypothetical protein SCLCIDRAFT_690945 [Scleroderma citrinum Foug A]|uniref:Uncharacterized protein n=1 Tax=Scleroderma citrinum Foug A TaxID=1036808 RepID=A0A0C3AFW7_9AGAM|nr:hypothetical protein SCLCIDRAFT_690945 [Scleroderma citrinum Foug A]
MVSSYADTCRFDFESSVSSSWPTIDSSSIARPGRHTKKPLSCNLSTKLTHIICRGSRTSCVPSTPIELTVLPPVVVCLSLLRSSSPQPAMSLESTFLTSSMGRDLDFI